MAQEVSVNNSTSVGVTISGAVQAATQAQVDAGVITNKYVSPKTLNDWSGGGTWGSITGTLSAQTDLQAALDAKWSVTGTTTLTGAVTVDLASYGLIFNETSATSGLPFFKLKGSNNVRYFSVASDATYNYLQPVSNGTAYNGAYFSFSTSNTMLAQFNSYLFQPYTTGLSPFFTIKGAGTTTGTAFLIEDSAGTDRFSVLDNGSISHTVSGQGIGITSGANFLNFTAANSPNNSPWALFTTAGAYTRINTSFFSILPRLGQTSTSGGAGFSVGQDDYGTNITGTNVSYGGIFYMGNTTATGITCSVSVLNVSTKYFAGTTSFNPNAGSATWKGIDIDPIYNQTGTASGNVYGIYYNPTTTSVLGTHYAAVFGSGNVVIGNTSGTTDVILDVQSTTKAFAPPRMTETQRDNIATPSAGMVVYNTTTNLLNFYNGSAWGAV